MHAPSLRTTFLFLAACAVTPSAWAQCNPQESAGPFVGLPMVMMVDNTPGITANEVYLDRAGLDGKRPTRWPTNLPATRPSFNLQSILQQCGATSTIALDDISLGDDWVIGDCSGAAVMPANRWAAVTFSVRAGTQGKAGSALNKEAAAGAATAAIFSYVLPGSSLPAALVGVGQRAQSGAEMGLPATAELRALDMNIPYYTLDARVANSAGAPVRGMMPYTPRVFFTLTAASAKTAPLSWFGGLSSLRSGATILYVEWLGSIWRCPQVWRSYRDLGLSQSEDIDGLAIDLDGEAMLFSTDLRIRARDPIQFFSWKVGCRIAGPVPYHTPTGQPVSGDIGLVGADDVIAICAMDPSTPRRGVQTLARPNAPFYAHGTPFAPTGMFPKPVLNGSAFRAYNSTTGQLFLESVLVGWTGGARRAGNALLLVSLPASLFPNAIVDLQARNTASPFCGDPRNAVLVVPPAPALVGASFALRWFAADASTLGEAYPVAVTL